MLGAIAGDMVGSPYEFSGIKRKDFPLFSGQSRFTDDTVMTLSVAEGLMEGALNEEKTKRAVTAAMQKYGRLYPGAGYGQRFYAWIFSQNPAPYNSYGNGSAMRVSPVGWMFDSLEETERMAAATACITHNHPEGIRGAKAIAGAIFLARTGASKEDIRSYGAACGYNMQRSIAQLRPSYGFDVRCQGSVGESLLCFLEAENYEDALRNAVSMGGDADTMAAMAGSVGEAYFGMPEEIRQAALSRLPQPLLLIYKRWTAYLGKGPKEAE